MPARPRMTPERAQQIAADLLAARRARHGNLVMTAPTGEQQTGAGEGGTGGEQQSTEGGQAGGQGGGQTSQTSEQRFTQADLDRILGERLSAEKAKHDQALKAAQELAGKNETEKLTIERDQATQRAQEATQKAAERVAKTEAKVAAIAAGANPERINAILRNADLSAAVKDGDVDEAAVKAEIDRVLTEFPEWKKAHTGPSSSGGELNGSESGKPSFTRAQIEAMSPDERVRRIDEINDAMANGRITG